MFKIYVSDRVKEVKDKQGAPLFIYDANIFINKGDVYPASYKHFSSDRIEAGHYALQPGAYIDSKGILRFGRGRLKKLEN